MVAGFEAGPQKLKYSVQAVKQLLCSPSSHARGPPRTATSAVELLAHLDDIAINCLLHKMHCTSCCRAGHPRSVAHLSCQHHSRPHSRGGVWQHHCLPSHPLQQHCRIRLETREGGTLRKATTISQGSCYLVQCSGQQHRGLKSGRLDPQQLQQGEAAVAGPASVSGEC